MRLGATGAVVSVMTGVTAALAVLVSPAMATTSRRVALRDSQSLAAARTPSVGSVAGSSTVGFQVDLRLSDAAGAAAMAKAVSTPGSALYGRYLSPAQWEQRFSPSAAAVQQVQAFLRRSGFTLDATPADRLWVQASGTAAQVERTFGTSLSLHRVNGQTVRLADTALSLPASVAGVVGGISGVSQTVMHPNDTTGSAAAPSSARAPAGQPIPQPPGFRVAQPCGSYYNQKLDWLLPPFGNGYPGNPPWAVCGYTGPQFRRAYGLAGSATGKGVTVAIVDAYTSPTLFSDARTFASRHDPGNPLRASQFSELPASGYNEVNYCGAPGWFGEETLDVEAVHNTAPGANILVAGAKNCETTSLNNRLNAIVEGHRASVITNSYGDNAGDLLDSPSDRYSTDSILEMAAATGVSVMFSSGDNGDEFTAVGIVSPDYPASSPYATAVGGTTLQIGSTGGRLGEYGWSTARSFLCNLAYYQAGGCTSDQLGKWQPVDLTLDGGSGGGTSYSYAQPFYQNGVVPTSLSKANGSVPMRVVPDISMEGDPATGMLVGETQQFPNGTYYDEYRIGGTSVASPLMAGVVARADQSAGHSLGFLNPALYSLSGNARALYDVRPAGRQDQSRADFVNSIDFSQGLLFTTRLIDYEGLEEFCATSSPSSCSTRTVALHATGGYDNMTGLGAPNAGFVGALAQTGSTP